VKLFELGATEQAWRKINENSLRPSCSTMKLARGVRTAKLNSVDLFPVFHAVHKMCTALARLHPRQVSSR
jgi:hypothetical protein